VSAGGKVLLLEKNSNLGKKLRITGGGRCNLTNATFDNRVLLANYTTAKKFLFSAFARHTVTDTLAFFSSLNLLTKTEAENRVFPLSERAEDVAKTLEDYLAREQVTVVTNCQVLGLNHNNNLLTSINTNHGLVQAKHFVLATGGTSRPDTGSTGEGYSWLSELGHTVITPTPSLVPVNVKESWVASLAGLTIPKAILSIYQGKLLIKKTAGKILFTHQGLSGPGILNVSTLIGDTLEHGPVTVKINLTAIYSEEELIEQLKKILAQNANKKLKNILSALIPAALIPVILELAHITSERKCNSLTRTERHLLILYMRGLPLEVTSLLGPEKAIVASGGVELEEINFKTMQSQLYKNLFIIGDLLNIKRPSGGYSLQLCWTTGFIAGEECKRLGIN